MKDTVLHCKIVNLESERLTINLDAMRGNDLRKKCFPDNVSVSNSMKKASLVQIVILEGFLSAAIRDRSDKCRRGLEKVKEGVAPGREYLFFNYFCDSHSSYICTFNK